MRTRQPCTVLLGILVLVGIGVAIGPLRAQELPRLEYDSARGVFTLWYLDDQKDRRSVELVPPNRVDPVAEVTVDDGPRRQYRYVVANRGTERSSQPLWMFEAQCPPPGQASVEVTPVNWKGEVLRNYRGSGHVCQFRAPHLGKKLSPGETENGFVVASDRLPGLVIGRAWGVRPDPPALEGVSSLEPEEAALLAKAAGTQGGWREFPMVVPSSSPPPADPVDHLGAVRSDQLEVCELGWIDESRVCNSLEKKLVGATDALERDDPVAARDKLESFLSELDAQRSKHVNDNAYWLLYLHGEDTLNRI